MPYAANLCPRDPRRALILFLAVLVGFAVRPATAAEPAKSAKPGFSRVAEILEKAIDKHAFPGCSVAVGNHEHVLWTRGFGQLDYDDGPEATADDALRSGLNHENHRHDLRRR